MKRMRQNIKVEKDLYELVKNIPTRNRTKHKCGAYKQGSIQWNKGTSVDVLVRIVLSVMDMPHIQDELKQEEKKFLEFLPTIDEADINKRSGKLQLLCLLFLNKYQPETVNVLKTLKREV